MPGVLCPAHSLRGERRDEEFDVDVVAASSARTRDAVTIGLIQEVAKYLLVINVLVVYLSAWGGGGGGVLQIK